MPVNKNEFIKFAIKQGVLKFGEFKLKSGRISPYFFNAGLFQTGESLATLGQFYADAIKESNLNFDILFGPAYKGIPLVASTAISLSLRHQLNYPYCFNRKEAKDHGEGGQIVGAALHGKVLIVDDVITAGTAIRESMQFIKEANATLAGIIVTLDRMEKGQHDLSAIEEIKHNYNIEVITIINFHDLVCYLQQDEKNKELLQQMHEYHVKYGCN